MASKSGAQSYAGLEIATTWGTAVAAGAGDKLVCEINPSFNTNTLVARAIGSGAYMSANFTRGTYIPTWSLTGDAGYRNNMDKLIAVLWGTSPAPSEVTNPNNDWKHTITFNTTLNAKYVTFAYETSTATTIEAPTAAVRSFGLRTTSVPGYLEWTAELLGNKAEFSSSTNTNATLANVTNTDTELVAVDFDDDFWIDDQSSGALASGDQYNITGFDFSFTRPQDIIPEIKGAAGHSAPVASGLAEGTFNVTVKELADHTYFTVWSAETAKKASINVEGTQIGAGTNKAVVLYIPRLILVQEPQYALTSEGTNTLALNFNIAVASANPTGMTSTYPYWEITNGLATSLLA